jgi:hypothetical protein
MDSPGIKPDSLSCKLSDLSLIYEPLIDLKINSNQSLRPHLESNQDLEVWNLLF